MNLVELVLAQARARPQAPAIIAGERTLTFAELSDGSARAAAMFRHAGLVPGDAVLVFVPMGIELYILLAGLWRAGLVALVVDPSAGRAHLARSVSRMPPKGFVGTAMAQLLRLSVAELRRIPHAWSTGFPWFCRRWSTIDHQRPDDRVESLSDDHPALVTFTSGSTGEPKGVVLSQHNIASNVDAVNELMRLQVTDRLLGVLPFFHSFGFTVTMWLPLSADPSAVYHFNPLDARTVGSLTQKYQCTILAATPTFLRSYLKRCSVEEMQSMNLVIVGAEKMPDDLRLAFKEKFGFEPTEGYGTTEMSPVASFNIPETRMGDEAKLHIGTKHGSVGRVIPGSAAAVFDPGTGEMLGSNEEGLLKIKGPNIMLGYLNQPEKTAELIQDGWYNSGDMAVIDDDGFIRITGRVSRFSKIGGEMVPHILVEQEIAKILEEDQGEEHEVLCAVTSVPDIKKGERLIVLHRPLKKSVREITDRLQAAGLPNLFIPSSDGFILVESIPMLGTGKLDLRAVKLMAEEKCGM